MLIFEQITSGSRLTPAIYGSAKKATITVEGSITVNGATITDSVITIDDPADFSFTLSPGATLAVTYDGDFEV